MPQPRTEDLFLDLYAVEDNIRMDVASRSDYPAAASATRGQALSTTPVSTPALRKIAQ